MRAILVSVALLALAALGCGGIDSGPIRPDTRQDCEERGGEWVESSGGYCIETA